MYTLTLTSTLSEGLKKNNNEEAAFSKEKRGGRSGEVAHVDRVVVLDKNIK